jgi:hypothetical protein
MAQAVECLPSRLKALSSNPTTVKEKKKKRKEIQKSKHGISQFNPSTQIVEAGGL